MRELNLLSDYPPPLQPRYVGKDIRTIKNRIRAAYRDERYYDGDRNDGYGGYHYDGRWVKFTHRIVREYDLSPEAALLQVGCEKGFLLHDFHEHYPGMRLAGFEISEYARYHAMESIRHLIDIGRFYSLPYEDKSFDVIIAIGVVYTLTLADAMSALREIQRVGQGKSFITLGAFHNQEEEHLFRQWTVLGSTILHVDEWREVLQHVGYTGDYAFSTAKTLNLVPAE